MVLRMGFAMRNAYIGAGYIYRYGGGMRGLKEVGARYEMKCFLQGCCMVVLQLVCKFFMRK